MDSEKLSDLDARVHPLWVESARYRKAAVGHKQTFAVATDAYNFDSRRMEVRIPQHRHHKEMLSSLQNLALLGEIAEAFPGCTAVLSDTFIEENANVLEISEAVDLHIAVPAYMAWCARNGRRPSLLVHDYTVNALAEFGRSKNPQVAHLDFKHRCTAEQKRAVLHFLNWYLNPGLLINTEQVIRAIKRWSAS